MSLLEILLFVHILGVVIWLGGAAVGTMLGTFIWRHDDAPAMSRFCIAFASVAGPAFGGSSLIVLITGIWMTALDGSPEFSDLWVVLGLAGWLISTIIGAGIAGTAWTKLGRQLQDDGATLGALTPLYRKAVRVTWFDVALRVALVLLMVWRPT